MGRTVSALQLRQRFCPAHGSVPAVLQRKAPLPPLCIMTNQGRQAAVPLAHHSTVSLPMENKLTKLWGYNTHRRSLSDTHTPLRTLDIAHVAHVTYGVRQPGVNQVTGRRFRAVSSYSLDSNRNLKQTLATGIDVAELSVALWTLSMSAHTVIISRPTSQRSPMVYTAEGNLTCL